MFSVDDKVMVTKPGSSHQGMIGFVCNGKPWDTFVTVKFPALEGVSFDEFRRYKYDEIKLVTPASEVAPNNNVTESPSDEFDGFSGFDVMEQFKEDLSNSKKSKDVKPEDAPKMFEEASEIDTKVFFGTVDSFVKFLRTTASSLEELRNSIFELVK